MRRAGAPRSPLKTAVLTITVLGLLYWWFRSPSAASVNQATPTPQARWTPRGKGPGAGEVHGDARDLGFKQMANEPPSGPPPPQRVRVAPADAPPARKPPPPPAQVRKQPIPNDRDDYDKPIIRKQRLDVEDGDAAFARAAKAVDRRVGGRDDEAAPPPPLRDDDDLDGAQNKKKAKLGKGKKKLPLGGGWKPVDPAPPAAAPGDKKVQDKWGNSGWQARFKQKGGTGAGAAGAKAASENEAADPIVSEPVSSQLTHPLVARYAALDLSREGKPEDEETFQANPPPRKAVDLNAAGTYNLTVCALIPGESRFLPEWLLYHRLLGVDRFVLYDTSAGAAVGAAEVDGLADRMQAEGKGELGPTAEEIKANVARASGTGLDSDGLIYGDRIAGLERWIEAGIVDVNYMKFKDSKSATHFHQDFIDHCSARYSKSTNWLIHIDIDEFLYMAAPLYGHNSPYQDGAPSSSSSDIPESVSQWRYPLHDLLARPATADAACIPVPQLKYRNLGVRELAKGQSVLDTQTMRDAIKHGNSPEKTLLHTAYSTGFVKFDGPHSCKVSSTADRPDSVTDEIKNSQGIVIQEGGTYSSTRLPTEPLAIAHFVQRDLADCHSKLGAVDDPNAAQSKGRGAVICEEHYMPSQEEVESRSFNADSQNRFLLRTPPEGTVVQDPRMQSSWASKATKAILQRWKQSSAPSEREIRAARKQVRILNF
ncbi:hypothetical protein BCR35DRAFT_302242 [Leucosporidium creatinivorum]|uniref:Glycosyltransferase family 92 protein n=1 Tax=Leucosporidium creatinivorum TaxID=106004 RepID=A0A1Y2FVZ3_9BASI|nr:hypothetical protein BCR35DRAFT_302242 [Leucosporidium creatinivorum]